MMELIERTLFLLERGWWCHGLESWSTSAIPRGIQCDVVWFPWWVAWAPRLKMRLMLWRQFTKGREIARLLNSWKPDVVVTNTLCTAVGAFAARKLGAAHVWHIREFGFFDHGLHFLLGRRLSTWTMNRYSDAVMCNSQAVAQHFSDGIPADKHRVIYNRMKPRAEAAARAIPALRDQGSLNCLMLGTVSPGKRQEDALIAVGQLARVGLDVRLSIVGPQIPEYMKVLDKIIDEYGIRERVEFVDWVADPSPYVRAADALLMCSRMEAFGRVTVEAMQAGRPVIGTRSGGTTELIRDGETGLLFEVGNPIDLAQKIQLLYSDRELLAKLGAAARTWTKETFTEEATSGKVYELLRECTENRSARQHNNSVMKIPAGNRARIFRHSGPVYPRAPARAGNFTKSSHVMASVPNSTIHRSMHRRFVAATATTGLLTFGIGGWAATTKLAGEVVAPGSLVVDTNLKKVQHPTGGVVGELNVQDGSVVKAGDILVRLDDTVTRANLAIVAMTTDELTARQSRLRAEREGSDQVRFGDELTGRNLEPAITNFIREETRIFQLRRTARQRQIGQLNQRIVQFREQIQATADQVTAKAREIELIGQELRGVREIWEKKMIPITRLTALERDAARSEGERGALVASMAHTKGKITETELQILQVDRDLHSEVDKDLSDIRGKLAELVEKKVAAEDQLKRIDIRAPQDGIVHELAIHTIGGVVNAGEQIMLVVPRADALTAAKIAPQGTDKVRVGHLAIRRFSAFSQRTTPDLSGNVGLIPADVAQDQKTGTRLSARDECI